VYTYAVAWLRRFIGLSEPSPGGREVVGSRAAGAIEGVCWLKSANISCALMPREIAGSEKRLDMVLTAGDGSGAWPELDMTTSATAASTIEAVSTAALHTPRTRLAHHHPQAWAPVALWWRPARCRAHRLRGIRQATPRKHSGALPP
jgi:hypothetical protein